MSTDRNERLVPEISLLEAMYPDQVAFDEKASELRYTSNQGSFQLRLPNGYLDTELPEVLSVNLGRNDGRDIMKQRIADCQTGEEILDYIIAAFNDLADQLQVKQQQDDPVIEGTNTGTLDVPAKATVIVWLHHLLNTNKRKQALSPPPRVSGFTKPGYPGVLLYSGPANAVNEHVTELRQLNWQAFSVRLESDEAWFFKHGVGVKEFETMKDLVADIGDDKKEQFMEAMRMK